MITWLRDFSRVAEKQTGAVLGILALLLGLQGMYTHRNAHSFKLPSSLTHTMSRHEECGVQRYEAYINKYTNLCPSLLAMCPEGPGHHPPPLHSTRHLWRRWNRIGYWLMSSLLSTRFVVRSEQRSLHMRIDLLNEHSPSEGTFLTVDQTFLSMEYGAIGLWVM